MQQRHAFTLVELSIVLVILGLLIGGVLTGQSLIKAAELRSVSTQYSRYVTAIHTFRDKYFALPGDMTNAQSYWGVAHATPATCRTTASTTAVTCNGDGDGAIEYSAGSNEYFRFWQHLANAGLIEGSYDGIQHGTTADSTTSQNSPSGRLSGSLWWANTWGFVTGQAGAFEGEYGNGFEFAGVSANDHPINPVMKAEEAYNIDMKIDDGKPAQGKVIARCLSLSACSDTSVATNTNASYLLTNNALSTAFIFRFAY